MVFSCLFLSVSTITKLAIIKSKPLLYLLWYPLSLKRFKRVCSLTLHWTILLNHYGLDLNGKSSHFPVFISIISQLLFHLWWATAWRHWGRTFAYEIVAEVVKIVQDLSCRGKEPKRRELANIQQWVGRDWTFYEKMSVIIDCVYYHIYTWDVAQEHKQQFNENDEIRIKTCWCWWACWWQIMR